MKVKSESEVAQLCPTLCDPMDCSLPGSSVHGIFQARVLEWGAISFSKLFPNTCFSHIKLYVCIKLVLNINHTSIFWGLPWWLRWWRICLQCWRPRFDPWTKKITWSRKWQPTSALLPEEFNEQKSLAGYNQWVHKESDVTELLTLSLFSKYLDILV